MTRRGFAWWWWWKWLWWWCWWWWRLGRDGGEINTGITRLIIISININNSDKIIYMTWLIMFVIVMTFWCPSLMFFQVSFGTPAWSSPDTHTKKTFIPPQTTNKIIINNTFKRRISRRLSAKPTSLLASCFSHLSVQSPAGNFCCCFNFFPWSASLAVK